VLPLYLSSAAARVLFHRARFSHFLSRAICVDCADIYRRDLTAREHISLSDANITVTQSAFTSVHYETDGGAIFAVFPGDLFVSEVRFESVSSSANGGVIFFHGRDLFVNASCFAGCAAVRGMAVLSARSLNRTVFDADQLLGCSGADSALWLYGFTLELVRLNFTNGVAQENAGVFVQPVRNLRAVDQTVLNNSGESVLQYSDIVAIMAIETGNVIENQAVAGCIRLVSYDLVITGYYFHGNDPFFIGDAGAHSAKFLSCIFDKPMTGLSSWVVFPSCVFTGGSPKGIAVVESEKCWVQNRYVFEEPALFKKVIVGCVFGALALLCIAYVIHEAYLEKKKIEEIENEQNKRFVIDLDTRERRLRKLVSKPHRTDERRVKL
jgi:hypothetical protein